MQVNDAIRSLRASRCHSSQRVEDDLLTGWVESARWCGSSRNSQPWRFVAVRDRDTLRTLSRHGDSAYHLAECDVAVVVVATPSPYPFSLVFDLGRVAQCLMLLAHADGVGSCVAVFGPNASVVAAGSLVGIPPEWSAELAIGFGYPRPGPRTTLSPGGRVPAAELLHWERYSGSDL
jgi:nitroreductase